MKELYNSTQNFIKHSGLQSNFITEELEQDSIVIDSRNIQWCSRIGSLTFQDVADSQSE